MKSVLAVAAVLSAAAGVFAAPPVPVNLTVSDVVRAGNHLDMAQDTVTEWDGDMYAFQPGVLPQRLFRVHGVTTARAVPTTVGGYDLLQRELFLYYSLDSDVLASTFVSPWDGQSYPVIHTQNNPVYTVLANTTYPGSNSGDTTTVTVSTILSMRSWDRLLSNDTTRAVLEPFAGNLSDISWLDTTTYTFPTAQLPQTGKPQTLTNVAISRTRVSPLLPFMNAPPEVATTTTLMMIMTGRKVPEGIDGVRQGIQDELENRKLWAYEDAPVSRDDAGSGAQKAAVNGTNEWAQFATSSVFNPWRMKQMDAFPLQDIGDWCDA
ncbi:hypothetical protein FRC07_003255 [Ceratobasidium sp. 392]|nr:hypothetical protein FRC07_003255 [Ceratobasidium sp. 392]